MTDTAQATAFWSQRHADPEWIQHYADSIEQPHRAIIVDALRLLTPWSSLWELGCHCGPMLRAVQDAFPQARLGGCDVNQEAVDHARQYWPDVSCGAFPAASSQMPDASIDVVLSCYALAYLSPEDLGAALKEAARLARVAVILCEPISWDTRTGTRQHGRLLEWMHPYLHHLKTLPAYQGWTADIERMQYDTNNLTGMLVLKRP